MANFGMNRTEFTFPAAGFVAYGARDRTCAIGA